MESIHCRCRKCAGLALCRLALLPESSLGKWQDRAFVGNLEPAFTSGDHGRHTIFGAAGLRLFFMAGANRHRDCHTQSISDAGTGTGTANKLSHRGIVPRAAGPLCATAKYSGRIPAPCLGAQAKIRSCSGSLGHKHSLIGSSAIKAICSRSSRMRSCQ